MKDFCNRLNPINRDVATGQATGTVWGVCAAGQYSTSTGPRPCSSGHRCWNQRHRDQLMTRGKVWPCTHYSVSLPLMLHPRSYFIRPSSSAGWSRPKQCKITKCQAGKSYSKADVFHGQLLLSIKASMCWPWKGIHPNSPHSKHPSIFTSTHLLLSRTYQFNKYKMWTKSHQKNYCLTWWGQNCPTVQKES